jgi:hypothetical protein
MSDTPTEFDFAHNPLRVAVELTPGAGNFLTDPRLTVERLLLGSNHIASQAMLQCYGGPIDSEPPGKEPALDAATVLLGGPRWGFGPFIGPDQEILIYRDGSAGSEVLFSGYCTSPRYDERGATSFEARGGKMESQRSFTLCVRGMLERLSTEPVCQVAYRAVRSPTSQDAIAAELEEDPEFDLTAAYGTPDDAFNVPALQCVFNSGGKPNRGKTPIAMTVGEDEYNVYLFTSDGDPDAEPWTYAQALRHLAFCFLFDLKSGDTLDDLSGVVKDGNVFAITDPFIDKTSAQEAGMNPPVADDKALEFLLRAEPKDLNLHSMNFPEALIVLTDAAKIRFYVITVDQGWPNTITGLPVNRLFIGAPGTGEEVILSKEAIPLPAGRSAWEILQANKCKDLTLQAVYDDVITWPLFLGDIRRYEVTVNLVPGWEPDANVDDVADTQAALDFAEAHWGCSDNEELSEDPWFLKYHKGGRYFHNYANVGRRWVLNETGRYRGDKYGREAGLYKTDESTDAYAPWTPDKADITDTAIDLTAGHEGEVKEVDVEDDGWAYLPRPLRPCYTADSDGRSLGIVVEVCFDPPETAEESLTWHPIPEARIMNLDNEAGIYVDSDDLTKLVLTGDDPADSDDIYFWKALVMGQCRVRVTAVIEGDGRLTPDTNNNYYQHALAPAVQFHRSRVFDVSQKYHSNRRDGGNSQYKGSEMNVTTDEGDDLAILQRMAVGLLDILGARQNVAAVVIPWLTTDVQPCNTVSGIAGMGIALYSHGAGRAQRRTDVVAVEYLGAYTRVILEDARLLTQLEF